MTWWECRPDSTAKENAVIPGWSEGPDPESRGSGFDASHRPGTTVLVRCFASPRDDGGYDISFFKISAKRSRQSFAGILPRIACWISGTPSESILPPQPG